MKNNIKIKIFFAFLCCFFSTFLLVSSDDQMNQIASNDQIAQIIENQKEIVKQLNPSFIQSFMNLTTKYVAYGTATSLCGLGVLAFLTKYYGLATPKDLHKEKESIKKSIVENSQELSQELNKCKEKVDKDKQNFQVNISKFKDDMMALAEKRDENCLAIEKKCNDVIKLWLGVSKAIQDQNTGITSIHTKTEETAKLSSQALKLNNENRNELSNVHTKTEKAAELSSQALKLNNKNRNELSNIHTKTEKAVELSSQALKLNNENRNELSSIYVTAEKTAQLNSKALKVCNENVDKLSQIIKGLKSSSSSIADEQPAGASAIAGMEDINRHRLFVFGGNSQQKLSKNNSQGIIKKSSEKEEID